MIVVWINNGGLICNINTYQPIHVLVDIIRWDEPWLPTEGVAPVRPVVANAKQARSETTFGQDKPENEAYPTMTVLGALTFFAVSIAFVARV